MRVPVRWLRDMVDTELPTTEIAHRLTMAGLEAESVTRVGEEWEYVFVGEVIAVVPHPDADRLVLATVHAGPHQLTVVTGAPNILPGQKIALALVGARLIDPYVDTLQYKTLKASKIRGVKSEGMVCSEKELGMSEEHEGILVLPDDAPVGVPLRDYLGDDVIEFEITPNLVHAFSVVGIARELAAILDLTARNVPTVDLSTMPRDDSRVVIEAPDLCARYALAVIEDITVGPSPDWMQRRLTLAGMRPVNSIVDITNYVMLEVGQPMHGFDAEHIHGGRIIVRRARPGEQMETLDHVMRELDDDTLVIADVDRAVAIAGVMGGVESEVSDSTTTILLESASFGDKPVRRTVRNQKLPSEASARFMRGVDPNLAWVGLQRFVALLAEIDPKARVTAVADAYPRPRERNVVRMRYAEVERLLGMQIPIDTVVDILGRLDLQPLVEDDGGDPVVVVSAPTYRSDINIPADVVEEIIRVYGYESLPETLPTGRTVPVSRDPARLVDRVTQDALVAAGLTEVITYSMISDVDLASLAPNGGGMPRILGAFRRGDADMVRATNPPRADWEIMRPTMLPSLLRMVSENLKYGDRVAIFETARTYQPRGRDELPDEPRVVAIALSGARESESWFRGSEEELDFFDLKGVVQVLGDRLGVRDLSWSALDHPSMQPGRSASIELNGVQIGVAGEVHPRVAHGFAVAGRVAFAEIDLTPFAESLLETWNVSSVSRFQPIRQDFAVVVDADTPASAVWQAIADGARPLASDITLFDIYRGRGIGEGKKSLAYRVTFSAPDRQLAEHEVERIRGRITQNLTKRVKGILRA